MALKFEKLSAGVIFS